MISLVAKSVSEPCVSLVNTWFVKVYRRLLSIFCHLRNHWEESKQFNRSYETWDLNSEIACNHERLGVYSIGQQGRFKISCCLLCCAGTQPSKSENWFSWNKPCNVGGLTRAVPVSGSFCSHTCLCGPRFPKRNEDVFGENEVLRSLWSVWLPTL